MTLSDLHNLMNLVITKKRQSLEVDNTKLYLEITNHMQKEATTHNIRELKEYLETLNLHDYKDED